MSNPLINKALGIKTGDLRTIIEDEGYTLHAFAKTFDIPYTTLLDVVNSDYGIDRTWYITVKKIAGGLGLTTDQLHTLVKPRKQV